MYKIFRQFICFFAILFAFGVPNRAFSQGTGVRNYRFINGNWFDGKSFRKTTFFSVNGMLTRKAPPVTDETVDLKGGFVVPPFGDAHCHHFDGDFNIQSLTEQYIKDGIFYAQTMTNSLIGAKSISNKVNIPGGIDVGYAHACLTGSDSHPILLYEGLGMGIYSPRDQYAKKAEILKSRRRENDVYFIIDTKEDLEKKWNLILAGKPDLIKVILLHSENYAQRKKDTGIGEGIDPELLPEIVKKAHESGLRVAAHVDSATDYHNALVSGVDIMAHLCGYFILSEDDIKDCQLTESDAALTAKRHVTVIPTANLVEGIDNLPTRTKANENQIRNLKLLKNAGVSFGIGTDSYGTDSLKEAMHLNSLGVWSNLELLKIWCESTPQLIFPRRKIGRLKEGFEASFVVMEKNPLVDFENVHTIRLRFKQGLMLP